MASWNNNYITVPKWDGSGINANSNTLTVSSLNANSISTGYIQAASLSTNNGSIAFLSNLVLKTGVIELGISPTILTAENGILYVNGDAVAFPSSFSTIADWSQFKAVANVDMSRSSIYNVQSISTNILSTGVIISSNISNRSLSTVNISSGNLSFDTLNGRTGTIRTLTGSNLDYRNSFFSNTTVTNINASNIITQNIVASNQITVPSISTTLISSFLIKADALITKNISSSSIIADNILTKGLSTLNISTGNITFDTGIIFNLEIDNQLNVKDIVLDTYTYPLYNSNTVYNPTDRVSYTTGTYQAVLTNLNVIPGENIPLWYPNSSYLVNNFTFVVGLGSYKCIQNISGSTTSPNGDEINWIDFSYSAAGTQLWSNINSTPPVKCGIVGDINSYISVGTIVASNANISSLSGGYANNVSTQLSVLSNFSTQYNPTAYSNWSLYPARSNVNFAGYNANNINTVNTSVVNTNSLTVGSGGQGWNGNAQFNQMASFPYWYNFVMDANITTTNANTIYCPTNNQYFSDWFVATNKLDPLTILPTAITTTKLHTYSAGNVIPTGYIDLRSHNYRVTTLIPVATLDYRGQLFLGTEGYGPNAYIGINYDGFEATQNVGTSIILNADSFAGSLLAGFSRITSQAARNQMLATVQTQIYAGYLGVDPAYTYYAGFEQSLLNAEGGGATQTMRSRGADVLGFPGSRTDITSECPENTSVPSQMNIYSSQNGNLYTDGDFYIGYGGSDPRYGFNSANQQIHIVNANDIQGRPNSGVTITNVNSVQGINSNSFINNIHYLVGYDTDVAFDINYLEFPREVRSTIDFKYSTIEFYSNVFVPSVNQYFTVSTLSSILFAQSSYTSSFILNKTDVSSFKTNINSFNVNKFNEILGISTILSSFIINVDRASIKQIDRVSTLRADNGFFSNITNSNIINTNILTANTGNFVNISTGTIRANDGFFSNIYGNTGNFNNISTNQLVARDGVFDGVSTNNISTKIINALITNTNLLNVQSIYNQFYSEPVAFPDNDVDFVNHNILNVKDLTASSISTINISTNSITSDSLSTNSILTSNISTNTLNMITGTGNVLSLKSYEGLDPILAIERTIDGVETPEGGFGSVDGLGLVLVGFSTLTIQASDDLKLESGQNIRLSPQENVIVSASNLIVNRNANISSINTNFISTFNINATYVDLYSQDADLDPAIVFSRNIEGEKFGDGSITTNNTNGFQIGSASTMKIITADDMLIQSINGNIGILTPDNNIIISAPETIIPYNLNVSSISTGYVIAGTLIAFNGIGTANLTTSNLNTVYASTGSVYADDVNTKIMNVSSIIFNNVINQYDNNIDGVSYMNIEAPLKTYNFNYISNTGGNNPGIVLQFDTTRTGSFTFNANNRFDMNKPLNVNEISTGSLFVNNSVENSISSLRISSGSLFSGVISSIQFNASSINANRAFINNLTGSGSATTTTNLYPQAAGAQIGFFGSGGTNSGGFYNSISIRSTYTQVLVPDVVGAFSNNIRVQGNLSTQNVMVSSINNKLYPYTSTLNIPPSTFSYAASNTQSATVPYVLYSNVAFPNAGWYTLSQKAIFTRASGTSDTHQSVLYTPGAFISTPSQKDGYATLPYVNQNNNSTFTTLTTQLYISSTQLNRNIILYNGTNNNFVGNLFLDSLNVSYTPSFGIRPE